LSDIKCLSKSFTYREKSRGDNVSPCIRPTLLEKKTVFIETNCRPNNTKKSKTQVFGRLKQIKHHLINILFYTRYSK
jgi:hypothetical protein